MTDNGARALAERIDETARKSDNGYISVYWMVPSTFAAAILANGAAFLTADEPEVLYITVIEYERLRRIEAAARASRLSVDFYRDLDAALAQKGALVEPDQLRTAVALLNSMVLSGERHSPQSEAIVRAALQPEGSAGT